MNLYISPIERNELNFPASDVSTSINNLIKDTNDINLDLDFDSNVEDNLNEEDIEISEFYKNYISDAEENSFDNTDSQKKLNKVKLYFIVKSKMVKGKETNYAIPIRSFNALGNSILEKVNSFIASKFYVRVQKKGEKYTEGSPGARPYRLNYMVRPKPPFYGKQKFPLEDFMLDKKYEITDDNKLKLLPETLGYKRIVVEFTKEKTGKKRLPLYYDLGPHESPEAMLSNSVIMNTAQYNTDVRYKKSFNGEEEKLGFLGRLRELEPELQEQDNPFKIFELGTLFSVVSGNIDAEADKNIIPVFSNLEDAQDLLITVLEEVHQPFQVRRKIESPINPHYSKTLNYLDDSFTFQNTYFLPDEPKGLIDWFKGAYNINKSPNLSKHSDIEFYNENKYQTKGPFFIEDIDTSSSDVYVPMSQRQRSAPKNIWREADYWSFLQFYFPGQSEAYSWWESRDISDIDNTLLKKSQDMKIISIGLGDFLEFWNNPRKKNAELLFIPSSNDINKRQLPVLPKKSRRDKFYDYQQKFRDSKKQDNSIYTYDIKVSSN